MERAVEKQKDLFMCFVDFKKAFDRVKHGLMVERLSGVDWGGGYPPKRFFALPKEKNVNFFFILVKITYILGIYFLIFTTFRTSTMGR